MLFDAPMEVGGAVGPVFTVTDAEGDAVSVETVEVSGLETAKPQTPRSPIDIAGQNPPETSQHLFRNTRQNTTRCSDSAYCQTFDPA